MNVEIYLKEIGDVHDHIAGHANEHSGDRDDAFFSSDQTGGAAIIAARVSLDSSRRLHHLEEATCALKQCSVLLRVCRCAGGGR